MGIKNKRILITAGPTWVSIDKVRVISNIATGETGILLAERLVKKGAKVTLLLGPVGGCCLDKTIKIIRFIFFDELKNRLSRELSSKKYDIVIHTAAVADYRPKRIFRGKIKSGLKGLNVRLVPTPKLIDSIKRGNASLFLAGFKFAPESGKSQLLYQAGKLIRRSRADLIVANTVSRGRYNAYIVSRDKVKGPFYSKDMMAGTLIRDIGENYGGN